MRRVAFVLILLVGCSTYRGSARTAKVGAAMFAGSLALGALMVQADSLDVGGALLLLAVGGVGLDAMLAGAIGMIVYDEEPSTPAPVAGPGRMLATRKRVRGMAPEAHARCMEDRRAKLVAAQRIQDRKRRGEVITKIPACGTVEEVTVEVSAETGETMEEQLARRERAWAQTKRAGEAARAGDCETVMTIGQDLYRSDREFHDTVFARDVAIARCVWPEPAPAGSAP